MNGGRGELAHVARVLEVIEETLVEHGRFILATNEHE
jgi:hypothetical protein